MPRARTTRLGLALVLWGLQAAALGFCMAVLGAVGPETHRWGWLVEALNASAPAVMGLGVGLGLLGKALCLAVPEQVEARPLVAATLIVDAAALGLGAVGAAADLDPVLALVRNVLMIFGFAMFLVFLGRLAVHLEHEEITDTTSRLLKVGAALVTLLAALFVSRLIWPPGMILFGAAFVILLAAGGVRYGLLLASLRSLLGSEPNARRASDQRPSAERATGH